jgi:type VI secretion system lysozyme-like protein
MVKQWTSIGNLVPLFDRLTDLNLEEKSEPIPLINYDREQLFESIARECGALLNTRCKIPYKQYKEMDASSLSYGVPELYGFMDDFYGDPSSLKGAHLLVRSMEEALMRFEPRLHKVTVVLDAYDQTTQTAVLTIKASVQMEAVVESFSFPLRVVSVKQSELV